MIDVAAAASITGYYIDIMPSATAAKIAIVVDVHAAVRLQAEDGGKPSSTLSSLRKQFVFSMSSMGQTTREKFALCVLPLAFSFFLFFSSNNV
ncbi:hypothetical protein BDW02DRAFT_69417 [Decorospora gaudefroyi]|uniref:Uncharacterized protein n=1 Tax=Decorospora gaudefroyi TaxID=184978 RepID=A0A6A5K8W9_9PLEO|nr:hypothetical protein BDW02DRAFT_69417 [Decorospora gaudefroyi]